MWRITCLALLMVAGLHFAAIVQAQTDYSFSHWLEARERLEREAAKTEAAKHGISVEAVLRVEGFQAYLDAVSTPAQQRQADLKQYEKDKVEAAVRGISVEEVLAERVERDLAERVERDLAERARYNAAQAKRERAMIIILAVAATVCIALVAVLIKARRKIATSLSRRWRKRSKDFRVWVFGSFFWALGTLLFVGLVEPYGSRMNNGETFHMFSVMIVPPLFLGALWFGYKRFVK